MIIIAGIIGGEQWQEQRKFAHTVLRKYGMGKSIIEDKIKDEISFLLSGIQDTQSMQFDPRDYIELAVANITCSILFGDRYEYSNSRVHTYVDTMNTNIELLGPAGILNMFPALKYLPGDLFCYKRLIKTSDMIYGMLLEEIKGHQANVTYRESSDFIDEYLQRMSQTSDTENSSFHGNLI